MKKHAIIPVFIPHLGCPHSCIFCNQNQITARHKTPSKDEVISFVDTWLTTLHDVETVEIAFYGGSFTAIPTEMQNDYLEIAKTYKDRGLINKIHLSTRPDAIDDSILDNLKNYSVDTVELGVQSFDDDVLKLSKRGHDSRAVYKACKMIKERDLELGIQLMIGLPGDSVESCIYSAEETVKISPQLARLYPTIILPETELLDLYMSGAYTPLTREDAVTRTAKMYEILYGAGIYIMRVGLKSTDIINSENLGKINRGTYHPAFRQLVEDEIAREKIIPLLNDICKTHIDTSKDKTCDVILKSSSLWASSMAGHNGENRKYFKDKFPNLKLHFAVDKNLPQGEFLAEVI